MNPKTQTIRISGMTCSGCANKIEEAIGSLSGITGIDVIWHRSQGTITYDDTQITLNQICTVIADLGYHVEDVDCAPNASIHSNQRHDSNDPLEPIEPNESHESSNILSSLWFTVKSLAIIAALAILYDNTIGFDSLMLVTQDMSFGMVFIVGLITSIHCVTMCGGISLSLAMRQGNEATTWKQRMMPGLQYQIGRLVSYTLLGTVVGALGSVITLSSAGKSLLSLVAGIFMIAMALRMMGVADALTTMVYRFLPRMPKGTQKWLRNQKRGKAPFVVGFLNGFMPCGPLQAMQIYALQTGSWFYGGLSMFLFSLGTIPLMLAFSALGTLKNKNLTNAIYRFGALVVLVLGLTMTNRSLLLRGIDVVGKIEQVLGINNGESILAKPDGDHQQVYMELQPGTYQSITAVADTPIQWTIVVTKANLNGCNNEIVIPELGITIALVEGLNEINLPPMASGTYVYTCWMGMISSNIIIV